MNTQDFLTPPLSSDETDYDADDMDDMIDGDRQLTTDSDALDGGNNDSDLGSPRADGTDVMTEEESDTGAAGPATI